MFDFSTLVVVALICIIVCIIGSPVGLFLLLKKLKTNKYIAKLIWYLFEKLGVTTQP